MNSRSRNVSQSSKEGWISSRKKKGRQIDKLFISFLASFVQRRQTPKRLTKHHPDADCCHRILPHHRDTSHDHHCASHTFYEVGFFNLYRHTLYDIHLLLNGFIYIKHVSKISFSFSFIVMDYNIAKNIVLVINAFICFSYPFNFAIYCGMSR